MKKKLFYHSFFSYREVETENLEEMVTMAEKLKNERESLETVMH